MSLHRPVNVVTLALPISVSRLSTVGVGYSEHLPAIYVESYSILSRGLVHNSQGCQELFLQVAADGRTGGSDNKRALIRPLFH